MKLSFAILLLGLCAVAAMPLRAAAPSGIRVTDRIVPSSTSDTYPTHEANYGRGGWRSAATIAERDAIPAARREAGMTCYVEADRAAYILLPGLTNWARIGGYLNDITRFGARGDNATDNSDAIEAALAVTNHIEVPPGRYLHSRPIRFGTNGDPVTVFSSIGSYQGGWVSTNRVGEAEFVYVGPSTNVAYDFTPTVGLRYGLDIAKVSFNANGRADVCVKIKNAGRWWMGRARAYGATGAQLLVEASQFGELDGFSTSVNDETPAPTPGAYGVVLTNWAVVNTIKNPIIENGSGWGIVLTDHAWNNVIIGGASEKVGGGIKLDADSRYNLIETQWQETNSVTTPWLYIGTNCFHNRIAGIYQNESGKVEVHGSYNKFSSSLFGRVTVYPNGSRNTWENIILRTDGSWDDQTAGQQTVMQMINAAATWRTNIFPDSITFYGDQLKLWNGSQSYPRSVWARDSLLFGDGNAAPTAGWSLISAATLSTPNTLFFNRSGANDGLFYASVSGESYGRVRWNVNSQVDLGSGSADYDTWFKRGSAKSIQSNAEWQTIATNAWTIWSGLRSGDAGARTTMSVDGRWEIGDGSSSRTLAVGRATNNVLFVEGAIDLGMTNSPASPPATFGRLRALTDGAGKGRLVVVWPSGATNTLAIEP